MELRKIVYSLCAVALSLGVTQYAAASLAARRGPPPPVAKRAAVPKLQQMGLPNPAQSTNMTDFRYVNPEEETSRQQSYNSIPNQEYTQSQWSYGTPTFNDGYYYQPQMQPASSQQMPIDQSVNAP